MQLNKLVNCHKLTDMFRRNPILFLLIFLTHLTALAQDLDTIKRKDPGGWIFMQIKKDGVVWMEGNMHNNIKEGVWTMFWTTGYPQTMTTYVNGKKDGLEMRLIEEGSLDYIQYYKNDLLEGPRRTFHIRGPKYEETYYSEGKKNGKYTKWYKTAVKQEEGGYANDLRDGKTTWYSQDGKKSVEYEYEKGEMEGLSTAYYSNGKISEQGNYVKSEKSGTWKEFYENGNPKAEGKYEHNEKEGSWKQYDDKGKLTGTIRYSKGEEVKKEEKKK